MNFSNKKKLQLEQIMPLICESLEKGNDVKFFPRGTSMLPMLRQGRDCVVVSPIKKDIKKYDLPLYKRANGQYVLHRVVSSGDTFTCIGDNQFEVEKGVSRDQMIGVVTAFCREDREYRTDSVMYRMYCVLWHHSRTFRKGWRKVKRWLFCLKNARE